VAEAEGYLEEASHLCFAGQSGVFNDLMNSFMAAHEDSWPRLGPEPMCVMLHC
jgi:hypothetical protein